MVASSHAVHGFCLVPTKIHLFDLTIGSELERECLGMWRVPCSSCTSMDDMDAAVASFRPCHGRMNNQGYHWTCIVSDDLKRGLTFIVCWKFMFKAMLPNISPSHSFGDQDMLILPLRDPSWFPQLTMSGHGFLRASSFGLCSCGPLAPPVAFGGGRTVVDSLTV